VESAPVDLASGRGIEQALDGVDTVIHLAGVTKALSRPITTPQCRRHRNPGAGLQGRSIRWCMSAAGSRRTEPDGRPVAEDATPHRSAPTASPSSKANGLARSLVPDAVIVRPPWCTARAIPAFPDPERRGRGLVLEIAGGERWVQRHLREDLADGLWAAARV